MVGGRFTGAEDFELAPRTNIALDERWRDWNSNVLSDLTGRREAFNSPGPEQAPVPMPKIDY